MISPIRSLTVFISCPGDMAKEREAVCGTLRAFSRALPAGCCLNLWRYDKDASPGVADGGAQEVISAQIPQDYDVYLGILCSRLGTPTPRARSGTIEELEDAIGRRKGSQKPEILLYVCAAATSSYATEDVAAFLASFKGYYCTFNDRQELIEHSLRDVTRIMFRSLPAKYPWEAAAVAALTTTGEEGTVVVDECKRRWDLLLELLGETGKLQGPEQECLKAALYHDSARTLGQPATLPAPLARQVDMVLLRSVETFACARVSETLRGQLVAALLSIARVLLPARYGWTNDEATLARWIEARVCCVSAADGIIKFRILVAANESAESEDALLRYVDARLNAVLEANRAVLADAGIAVTRDFTELRRMPGLEPVQEALRERLLRAAADLHIKCAEIEHFGDDRSDEHIELDALAPIPESTIFESVTIPLSSLAPHQLEIRSQGDAQGSPVIARATGSQSISLPISSLPSGPNVWTLFCDLETGDLEEVGRGVFRTPSAETSASLGALAIECGPLSPETLHALGLYDRALRDIWELFERGMASNCQMHLARSILYRAFVWYNREDPGQDQWRLIVDMHNLLTRRLQEGTR